MLMPLKLAKSNSSYLNCSDALCIRQLGSFIDKQGQGARFIFCLDNSQKMIVDNSLVLADGYGYKMYMFDDILSKHYYKIINTRNNNITHGCSSGDDRRPKIGSLIDISGKIVNNEQQVSTTIINEDIEAKIKKELNIQLNNNELSLEKSLIQDFILYRNHVKKIYILTCNDFLTPNSERKLLSNIINILPSFDNKMIMLCNNLSIELDISGSSQKATYRTNGAQEVNIFNKKVVNINELLTPEKIIQQIINLLSCEPPVNAKSTSQLMYIKIQRAYYKKNSSFYHSPNDLSCKSR